MNNIFLCVNWNALSAISNIVLAIIAIATLGFSIHLLFREDKLRKEDRRARINCTITYWKSNYFLLIENVGKETAYDIILKVAGKPITENLYEHVKTAFNNLQNKKLVLSSGEVVHYMISPGISRNRDMGFGDDKHTSEEINGWLQKYDNEKIIVSGSYNNQYEIDFSFSIREKYPIGSFHVIDSITEIAESLASHDPKDKSIQKNLQKIANHSK